MKIVVIVPAYNEGEIISRAIPALTALKHSFLALKHTLDVYVINDGSTDETESLAKSAGADRVINHKVNIGLGAAVRTGLKEAHKKGADIVVKFDADLQHDPNDILALIDPIIKDESDIVYGHRFDQIEYKMPMVRRMGNKVFTALMRWLTKWPLMDSQPGIIALNRSYLDIFYMPGDYNYTQQILVDAYRKGMRFSHVSVRFKRRVTGQSFISFKYPFKVLPQIFMVLVSVKPLRVFGPIGGLFLGMGTLVFFIELIQFFMGQTIRPVMHVFLVLGFSLFGLQTLFFGVLAHLIVESNERR